MRRMTPLLASFCFACSLSFLIGCSNDHTDGHSPHARDAGSATGGNSSGTTSTKQPTFTHKTITNSIEMKLMLIPAGELMMGRKAAGELMIKSIATGELMKGRNENPDEKPVHRVRISKAFYLGIHEVTQGEWKSVMGTEPWKGKDNVKEGAAYPATCVSWDDAVEFCKKLSVREGRIYRLPTEAEWEYACRAGTTTAYSFDDNKDKLGDYAWFDENAEAIGEEYAHRVGTKRANPWGLHDLHGNLWEYCNDRFDPHYYKDSPMTDPQGPRAGSSRVIRGGGWRSPARYCQSASRYDFSPGYQSVNIGFRVAHSEE